MDENNELICDCSAILGTGIWEMQQSIYQMNSIINLTAEDGFVDTKTGIRNTKTSRSPEIYNK